MKKQGVKYTLYIVTGAPGAGKSTAVEAFTQFNTDYLAFDIDWLADSASELAGKSIYFEPSTWKPYGKVWFDVLHMIIRNGRTPIFFAPTDPDDIEQDGQPDWCDGIEWLLIDCDDEIRLARLGQRVDWTDERVAEAMEDAAILRGLVERRLDTGKLTPDEVAQAILEWVQSKD